MPPKREGLREPYTQIELPGCLDEIEVAHRCIEVLADVRRPIAQGQCRDQGLNGATGADRVTQERFGRIDQHRLAEDAFDDLRLGRAGIVTVDPRHTESQIEAFVHGLIRSNVINFLYVETNHERQSFRSYRD